MIKEVGKWLPAVSSNLPPSPPLAAPCVDPVTQAPNVDEGGLPDGDTQPLWTQDWPASVCMCVFITQSVTKQGSKMAVQDPALMVRSSVVVDTLLNPRHLLLQPESRNPSCTFVPVNAPS